VDLHGDLLDPELIRNLLVQPARDDACHNFPLARAQTSKASRQYVEVGLAGECLAASIEGGADRAQQQHLVERLGQEFHRAGLHCEYRRAQCRSLSGEDHGSLWALRGQRLQIQPASGEQLRIDHEAGQHRGARMSEVGASIHEALRMPTGPPYHRAQQHAQRGVCVDDEYDGRHEEPLQLFGMVYQTTWISTGMLPRVARE
jgi:hypothetical protein